MRRIQFTALLIGSLVFQLFGQQKSRDLRFQSNQTASIYTLMDSIRQDANLDGRINKQAERWYAFWEPRLAPSGQFDVMPDNYGFMYSDYMQTLSANQAMAKVSHTGNWKYIGGDHYTVDVVVPTANGGSGGAGRLNCLAIDPVDGNIIYVGAASGGLWKTIDGGINWTCLTDGMSNIAVSSIVIDRFDRNRIFIASGDSDSGDANYRDMGILMSEDGGLSWQQVHDATRRVYKILAHPDEPNTFYLCSMIGLCQTKNSFATVDTLYFAPSLHQNRHIWDAEFKPGNPDSLYFSSGRSIRCWNDANQQVTTLVTFPPGMGNGRNRIEIETTDTNPEMIVGFYARRFDTLQNGFIHHPVSTDAGATWDTHGAPVNIMGKDSMGNDDMSQATYDMCFVLGANDPSKIMTGGIQIWTSQDTGNTHICKTYGRRSSHLPYVHVDHHDMLNRNDTIYVVNDGGLYRTTDFGETWTELSDGIGIHQLYDMHTWSGNPDSIMGGLQDNGFYRYLDNERSSQVHGGDGMAIFQHPENPGIQLVMHTEGLIRKTTDNWMTVQTLVSDSFDMARFHSALFIDEIRPDTIYVAHGLNLVRTRTGDINWDIVFSFLGNGYISAMRQSDQNQNRFYIAKWDSDNQTSELRTSNNVHSMNPNFIVIGSGQLPDSLVATDIELQPGLEHKVFVSYSGFAENAKVYYRADQGSSFVNISAGLPNVPINDLEFEIGSVENGIYAATDIGIFYRNDTLGQWIYFSNGLPNVVVSEVEYIESQDIIRAATYGRGIWESDTYSSCPTSLLLTQANDPSNENYTGVQRYQAKNTIASTRRIVGGRGTDVRYRAGQYTELTTGFESKQFGLLQVEIGNCATSGVQYIFKPQINGMLKRETKFSK